MGSKKQKHYLNFSYITTPSAPKAIPFTMKYIAIPLYRKMIACALNEGMEESYFNTLKAPYHRLNDLQAVAADEFFELHERLDDILGLGFSLRVGQQAIWLLWM